MDKKSSQYLSEFLTFYRNLISEYERAQDEITRDQDATQDLLHQIEFGTYEDRRRYVTQLANIRKHRRKYKNFVEINSELYNFFKGSEMIKCYRAMESRLLGEIRKQERIIESKRSYNPKVIKNLPINNIAQEKETSDEH